MENELDNTAKDALAVALDEDTSKTDNGLVYITRTFTVDPTKYNSPTLRQQRAGEPADIKDAGKIKKTSTPTKDEMTEGGDVPVTDTRRAPTRETCETDISQCRAANPLFCRFHGPKLIEADIRGTLQGALGYRNGCRVSVTRDSSSDNPRAFKVTIACRPDQREFVEHALDGFLSEPGITATGDSEFDNGRMTQRYDADLERADRPPRISERTGRTSEPKAVAAQRLNRTNPQGTIREEREEPRTTPPTPSQLSEAGYVTAEALERAFGEAGENNQPAPEPPPQPRQRQTDNIEHWDGGIKSRFTDAEKNAIEAEKNRAIRESNANPDNAELRAYAHALSHFLGSAASRYGQRHAALRGIRDNITKAEMLEKAERRLADTQDHPDRYNGSVRALQKIAELSGLGGQIEIDGTTVRLANQATNGKGGASGEAQAPAATQGDDGLPQYTQEQFDDFIRHAAEQTDISEDATREAIQRMLDNNNFDVFMSNRHYLITRGVNTAHPVMQHIDARMRKMVSEETDPEVLSDLLERRFEYLDEVDGLTDAARARLSELVNADNPAAMSQEDLLEAGNLITDEHIQTGEEGANYLQTIINGGNPFFSNEMRANDASRLLQRLGGRGPASVRQALQSVIDGNRRDSESDRQAELAEACTTHPADYTPNQPMSADEILRIRQENQDFWTDEDGKWIDDALLKITYGDYYAACSDLAEKCAECVPAETLEKDDENVRRLMPDVGKRVEQGVFDIGVGTEERSRPNGLFNPFLSNIYGDKNCWKGALAVLMRLRGFPVTAREQTESSPILADSPNEQVRLGYRMPVFLATMDDMTSQYERIYGADEERTAKFKEMAEGNPEKGIAPYPDGTFVMTWDGHARANLLYKGKWFSIDPYYNDFVGADYIAPISPDRLSSLCTGVSRKQQKDDLRTIISQTVAKIQTQGRNFRWGGDDTDISSEQMRRRTAVLALAHYGRLSLKNGMPPADKVEEAIQKVIDSGALSRFQSSIVIRPTDTINKGLMACCKAIPQDG